MAQQSAHLVERHSRWRQFDRERVSESVQVLFLNFIEENIRRLTGFAAAHAKQKPKSNGQFRQEQLKLLSQDLLKRPKSRTVDFRHHF
jgi:hypothetical protein